MSSHTSFLKLDPQTIDHSQARQLLPDLKDEIRRHDRLYYVKDRPEISDGEYDRLFGLLQQLEEKFPDLQTPDSPTQRVGGKVLEEFERAQHVRPLLSLDSTRERDRVERFHKRVRETIAAPRYLMQPKYDGLSVELVYQNGQLTRATTRGDGEVGEVITANVKTIGTVPLQLATDDPPKLLAVRGEALIFERDFQQLNERLIEEGEKPFANPRNAAAGSLRQLDSRVAARRNLRLIAYDLLDLQGRPIPPTDREAVAWLETMGFLVPQHRAGGSRLEDLMEYHRQIGEQRSQLPFEIDGVVVKLDSFQARQQMGMTARAPRWALAIKYPPERATTRVRDITIQVGRTGALTPVAEMEPVEVGGVVVQRATLHNRQQAQNKDVRPGDRVFIHRAGDVIPEVVGRADDRPDSQRGDALAMPARCPVCGGKVVQEGPRDYCSNQLSCPAQLKGSLQHLGSREALDIEGLGEETAELLVDRGWVETPADLWRLTTAQLQQADGWGPQSAHKLVDNIQGRKQPPLADLLAGLGIPGVGQRVAQLLAREFRQLDTLQQASGQQLERVEGVGAKMAEQIQEWMQNPANQHILQQLQEVGVFPQPPEPRQQEALDGKRFVFTGSLEQFTRREASQRVEKLGGRTTGSVSGATDYLVAGPGAGSKLDQARELGTEILDEEAFLKLLEEATS